MLVDKNCVRFDVAHSLDHNELLAHPHFPEAGSTMQVLRLAIMRTRQGRLPGAPPNWYHAGPRGRFAIRMASGMTSDARKTDGTSSAAYSLTARVLHWITAALVLTMLPLGVVIANKWGGPWQDPLYNLHRSIGTVVMLVIIVRLGYRLTHKPLPLPDEIPPEQRIAARVTHWSLYALLVAQPFVGWAASSAYPAPVIVFGLFELPPIIAENRLLSDRLVVVHRSLALAIACLVALHIGAALYHHFVRRDAILMRMIEG
jgi:cytochrome b561